MIKLGIGRNKKNMSFRKSGFVRITNHGRGLYFNVVSCTVTMVNVHHFVSKQMISIYWRVLVI